MIKWMSEPVIPVFAVGLVLSGMYLDKSMTSDADKLIEAQGTVVSEWSPTKMEGHQAEDHHLVFIASGLDQKDALKLHPGDPARIELNSGVWVDAEVDYVLPSTVVERVETEHQPDNAPIYQAKLDLEETTNLTENLAGTAYFRTAGSISR